MNCPLPADHGGEGNFYFSLFFFGVKVLPSGYSNVVFSIAAVMFAFIASRYSARRAFCSSSSASVSPDAFCFFASSFMRSIFAFP